MATSGFAGCVKYPTPIWVTVGAWNDNVLELYLFRNFAEWSHPNGVGGHVYVFIFERRMFAPSEISHSPLGRRRNRDIGSAVHGVSNRCNLREWWSVSWPTLHNKLEWITYGYWRREGIVHNDVVIAQGRAENEEEKSGESHFEVRKSTCLSLFFVCLNRV